MTKCWNQFQADVVCRILGYRYASEATQGSKYGAVTDDYAMDRVYCYGNEDSLSDCSYRDDYVCTPEEAAGVVCKE